MPLGYKNRAYTVVFIDVEGMQPNLQQSPACQSSPPAGGFGRGIVSSPSAAAFVRRFSRGSPSPAHLQRAYSPPTSPMASRAGSPPPPRYPPSPDFNNSRSPVFYPSRSPVFNSYRSPAYNSSSSPTYNNSRSPAFETSRSPVFDPSRSPVFNNSRSPVYNSRSPAYGNSRSPGYYPPSPVRNPSRSPVFYPSRSPAYNPPSPMYNAPSPVYNPPSPVYNPPSPVYNSPSPVYNSPSPVYIPPSPHYNFPSPVYTPASPVHRHPSPVYNSASPDYYPQSPPQASGIAHYHSSPTIYPPASPAGPIPHQSPRHVNDMRNRTPSPHPQQQAHNHMEQEQDIRNPFYTKSPIYDPSQSPEYPYNGRASPDVNQSPPSADFAYNGGNTSPVYDSPPSLRYAYNAGRASENYHPAPSPDFANNGGVSPVFHPAPPSPDYPYNDNGRLSPDDYRPARHGYTNAGRVEHEEEAWEQQRQQEKVMEHRDERQEWHWTGAEEAMGDGDQISEQDDMAMPAVQNPFSPVSSEYNSAGSVVREGEAVREEEAAVQDQLNQQKRTMEHLSQMQEWHWTEDGEDNAASDEQEQQHTAASPNEEEPHDSKDYEQQARAAAFSVDEEPRDSEDYKQQARADDLDDLLDYEYYEELYKRADAEATKQHQQEKTMEHLAKMEEWHWSDESEEDGEKNEQVQQEHTVAVSEKEKQMLYKSYDCFQKQNWADDLRDHDKNEELDEMTNAEAGGKQQDHREKIMKRLSEMQEWHWNEDTHEEASKAEQVQQQPDTAPLSEDDDLPDYEYYEELDRMSETEAEMEIDTHSSPNSNPYSAIAALNHEQHPSSSANQSPLSSPESGERYDARSEHADFFVRISPRATSWATMIRTSVGEGHQMPKGPIGNVGIRKSPRLDKAMWSDKMQRKVAGLVRLCEQYVPKEVMEEFEREYA